jgi:D-alanine-D-alanine ligase
MTTGYFAGRELAVLYGGQSAERPVSLESGANVADVLEGEGATVRRIDTAVSRWWEQLGSVEFVFNLLHGPGGEDGAVQGLLETMGLPYSGSGVLGSALTMDKVRTKQVWQGLGLPTADYVVVTDPERVDCEDIIARLGAVFVKPAREGSSLGMGVASTAQALGLALCEAKRFGEDILVEQLIVGKEYTVAILAGRALPTIRIESTGTFYDFNAKYVSDETRFYCPSGLSADEERSIGDLALAAFTGAGAEVWGRVDILRDDRGQWYLLEVNTIPGMTSHSLVPMAAKAAKLSQAGLLEAIHRASLEVRP